MVYCLPAADVPAFIAGTYLAEYVASTKMAVVEILDDPWMEKDVIGSQGYSNSRRITLKFAVVYLDVPWPAGITRPSYRTGTTLKLHTTYGGQYLPLPPAGIKPAAGPVPGPGTQNPLYIALNEYHVEWDRVESAPNFTGYVGAVNSDSFMGCAAGQLLCAGASQQPSFVLDPTNPCATKTTVTLKQKAVVVASGGNAGTYGWNRLVQPQQRPMGALQPE